MNRHQLNGVQTLLELLDEAAVRGIELRIYGSVNLVVDGVELSFRLARSGEHYFLEGDA